MNKACEEIFNGLGGVKLISQFDCQVRHDDSQNTLIIDGVKSKFATTVKVTKTFDGFKIKYFKINARKFSMVEVDDCFMDTIEGVSNDLNTMLKGK